MNTIVEQSSLASHSPFSAAGLEQLFAQVFATDFNTQLCGGLEEPLYQPAGHSGERHCVYYREDYFASALHEVAHWCIAGEGRRQQVDYGYWYSPDGRSDDQQRAFEAVEDKPQALEWLFAKACGYSFRLSVDNLEAVSSDLPDTQAFALRVLRQAGYWQSNGLPPRAARFYCALANEFSQPETLTHLCLDLGELG